MTETTRTDEIIANAAASTKRNAAVKAPNVVEAVQSKMLELGYVDGGPATGEMGDKTKDQIVAFRRREGLPLTDKIDAELLTALQTAPPKVLPIEQTTATAPEIAPKVEAMAQTRLAKFWAKVTGWPAAVGTFLTLVINNLGDAVETLTPLKTFLNDFLSEVSPLTLVACGAGGVALVAVLLSLNSHKAETALTDGYQRGTVKNDNTEAKAAETAAEKEAE